MKLSSFLSIACAVLMGAATLFAQEKPLTEAEKASKAQNDAYIAAFNKGDAKALAEMYAEDAQYTADSGEVVIGRAQVLESMGKYFAKNKGATLSVQVESARLLTPDVLLEKGLATIDDETTRYVCSYVKKGGVWLITELDETTLPPISAAAVALDDLAWMVGSWKDNTPGITVTTNVDWTKNKHFLRRSLSIAREGEATVEATEVIGYDPVGGVVRSWVFDSEGGFGEGEWKHEANKWMISFKGTAPDGSVSTAQHVITYLGENKYTWESINRQSEGEVLPNLDKIEVVRDAAK